jgi:hypothetical protein
MNSPGPPVRGTANGPPVRGANVSEWLERAGQLFRVSLLKCLPLATIAVLCSDVPLLYWIASGHDFAHPPPADSPYWTLYMFAAAVALYVLSAVMLQQRSVALGPILEAGAALREALRRFPMLLLTLALAWVSLVAGFFLLILPGIFLLVCYLILMPVVLFERQNPYMTLVRCVQLVRRHWWKLLAALLIALLMMLAGVIVVGAVLDVVAALLAGQGSAFQAIVAAGSVAIGAVALSFLSALELTLHSALASSSA